MDVDTAPVDRAREHAERLEADAARARAVYYTAVAELVQAHGATRAAEALGITRARAYQLIDKAREHSPQA